MKTQKRVIIFLIVVFSLLGLFLLTRRDESGPVQENQESIEESSELTVESFEEKYLNLQSPWRITRRASQGGVNNYVFILHNGKASFQEPTLKNKETEATIKVAISNKSIVDRCFLDPHIGGYLNLSVGDTLESECFSTEKIKETEQNGKTIHQYKSSFGPENRPYGYPNVQHFIVETQDYSLYASAFSLDLNEDFEDVYQLFK